MYNKSLMEHRNADTLALLNKTEKTLKEAREREYVNLELCEQERDKGNAAFKEQRYPEVGGGVGRGAVRTACAGQRGRGLVPGPLRAVMCYHGPPWLPITVHPPTPPPSTPSTPTATPIPQAVAAYQEALKRGPPAVNPEAYKIYSNLAACYTKLGAYPEGVKVGTTVHLPPCPPAQPPARPCRA